MNRLPPLLALALTLTACGLTDPDTTRRTLEVAPHKAVCSGLSYLFCLRVREPGRSEWEFLYETPRGFTFEWGVTTRIVIEERELENPPLDASSVARTLVRTELRDRIPADSLFSLVVPGGATTPAGAGIHHITFGTETLRCDEAAGSPDCLGLAAALAGDDAVELDLALGSTPADPFRVVAWRGCGSPWPECPGTGN